MSETSAPRRDARRLTLYAYLLFFALVVVGFLLAASIDYLGTPGPLTLEHLAPPARALGLVLVALVGLPIVIGMALFGLLEVADFADMLIAPFRARAGAESEPPE